MNNMRFTPFLAAIIQVILSYPYVFITLNKSMGPSSGGSSYVQLCLVMSSESVVPY